LFFRLHFDKLKWLFKFRAIHFIKRIPMDLVTLRQDFPLLGKKINGKPLIYFDNACMSLRPRAVIDAIKEYYEDYPACGGRSSHRLSKKVDMKMSEARETVAGFINAKRKDEIVFTRNSTEGINLLARSLSLKRGDVVLTTDKEHNSNLIPWQIMAQKTGIVHRVVKSNPDNTFSIDNYKAALQNGVRLVAMVHTSNLDGVSIPAAEITRLAHKAGALTLFDAAQSAPHRPIDVRDLDTDFLVFSGHKTLGPTGTGVFYGKYKHLEALDPFLTGGSTVKFTTYEKYELLPPPEKFEAGLQDYANIIGLTEALRYLGKVGFKKIQAHELELNRLITDEILSIPRVHLIGPEDPASRGGIVSFYVDGADAHKIALMLDESANIMVRAGQHCVHSWFNAHNNITASVRASLYFYNTAEEAGIFIDALKKIIKIL
jgi:cysteine desulfurase / selenocysteine lyase